MAKVNGKSGPAERKACCLVSDVLDEMGLDAGKAREIRRQALVGLLTYCQWQLARMDEENPAPPRTRKPRGRRVKVV